MIADYVASIKLDVSDALKNLKSIDAQAERQTTTLGGRFSTLSTRIDGLAQSLSGLSIGAGVAFGGGAALLNKAADTASDLEESVNAVRVVFKDNADSILALSAGADKAVGLSRTQFNNIALNLQAQLKNAGFEGEALNNKIDEIVKRAADVGSLRNVETSDVLDKITAALRGEADPIESLGVIINDAAVGAEALSQGINKSTAKMSDQEKIAFRLSGILRQTADAEGDFARTSDGLANSQKILKAELQSVYADIGNEVLPIKQKLVNTIALLVKNYRQLTPEVKSSLTNFALGGLAIAGFAAVIAPVAFVLSGIAKAAGAVTVAVRVLSLAMRANPLGILLTAAVALASYLKIDFSQAFASAKKAISSVFSDPESLGSEIGELLDDLKAFANYIAGGFTSAFDGISKAIGGMVEQFREAKSQPGTIASELSKLGENLSPLAKSLGIAGIAFKGLNLAMRANPIGLVLTAAIGLVSFFRNDLSNAIDGFRNKFNEAKSQPGSLASELSKLWDNMKPLAEFLAVTFLGAINSVIGGIRDLFDWFSDLNSKPGELSSALNNAIPGIKPFVDFLNFTLSKAIEGARFLIGGLAKVINSVVGGVNRLLGIKPSGQSELREGSGDRKPDLIRGKSEGAIEGPLTESVGNIAKSVVSVASSAAGYVSDGAALIASAFTSNSETKPDAEIKVAAANISGVLSESKPVTVMVAEDRLPGGNLSGSGGFVGPVLPDQKVIPAKTTHNTTQTQNINVTNNTTVQGNPNNRTLDGISRATEQGVRQAVSQPFVPLDVQGGR